MDPISAASVLNSSSLGDASALAGDGASTLVQQAGGQTFAFHLPEAPQVEMPSSVAPAGQIYATSGEPTTFGHLAQQMIRSVNEYQNVAGEKVRDVLMGGPTTVNDAMIAVKESDVAFKVLSAVRDKVIDSYKQVMSMQI